MDAVPPGRPPLSPTAPADALSRFGPADTMPAAAGPPAADDTWSIVQRAQAGDPDAFGVLYDRYVDVVHRYLYYRLADRGLAEDFTSETFLRALRRLDTVTYQGRDLSAWLITIARNIVFDHVKSSRYKLEIVSAQMQDFERPAEGGTEYEVLAALDRAELLRCVALLSSEQQECIVLRFIQGLSLAETAQAMGKKPGAIKALQHRAVRRLAELLPSAMR